MKVFYPSYFEEFHCIADQCPDSCCKEWAVDIDEDTAALYRQLPDSLGEKLRSVLTEDNSMVLENGRCPMWRQDGLCEIQAQLGHDALCQTCRDFPRISHNYGDFIEYGLELSCPAAAELILSADHHCFLEKSAAGEEVSDYVPEIMQILRESRQAALDFLEEDLPLGQSLAAIFLYAHHVQRALDGGELDATPQTCYRTNFDFQRQGDAGAVLAFFRDLEILTDTWRDRLRQVPVAVFWSAQLRAMARYLIERYWLQAISDFDLVCRAKFVVVSCLLVGLLGGEVVATAQLFSKEIENDPDNIAAILDSAYSAPALTDLNLLSLLLA